MKNFLPTYFYTSTQVLPGLKKELALHNLNGQTIIALYKIYDLENVPVHITTYLSSLEKERMLRYRKADDRCRFVYAHVLKRVLLAAILKSSPFDLEFEFTSTNKPLLLNSTLHFNLSHSFDTVAIAVNRRDVVGVDVEQVRESFDYHDFIKKNYHADEIAIIEQDKDGFAHEHFFKYWSRKESLLKATGLGVFSGLNLLNMTDGIQPCMAEIIQCNQYYIRSMRLLTCWLSICQPSDSTLSYLDANAWLETKIKEL